MCWVGNHPSTVWCREKMCRDMLLGRHCPVQCRISTTYILTTTGPSPELHPLAGPAFAEMFWHFLINSMIPTAYLQARQNSCCFFPCRPGWVGTKQSPLYGNKPSTETVTKSMLLIFGAKETFPYSPQHKPWRHLSSFMKFLHIILHI